MTDFPALVAKTSDMVYIRNPDADQAFRAGSRVFGMKRTFGLHPSDRPLLDALEERAKAEFAIENVARNRESAWKLCEMAVYIDVVYRQDCVPTRENNPQQ